MYKKKISGLPHARKQKALYLEVLRHRICGRTVSETADVLATTEPTVRRAISRTRFILCDSEDFKAFLYDLPDRYGLQNYSMFREKLQTLHHLYLQPHEFSFHDVHICTSKCKIDLSPRKFVDQHVEYLTYNMRSYLLEYPISVDRTELLFYVANVAQCRYCPLKKNRALLQSIFCQCPRMYLDIMSHLSRLRVRSTRPIDLLILYNEAFYLGLIKSVIIHDICKNISKTDDNPASINSSLAFFNMFTEKIFDFVLNYDRQATR